MLEKMERYVLLLQAVVCLFWCGVGNASPTLIPPDVTESLKAGGEEMGYLLTMPQTLQAGAQEQYCLTLHGVDKDVTLTLELTHTETEEEEIFTYTHTYINGQSQCKSFQVPSRPGRYEVSLQNETDTFATSEVTVLGNNLITFVQTDKPMYKPGQKVKFRILTMTRNLRSRVGKIESVLIKDPNDFKVKKFAEIDSRGMASLDFQLISEAKLGMWTIEVTVEGAMTTQRFKVEEYVLPRFEVTVKPPAYFLVTSATYDGTVCAKYTYGKPVQAFLHLQICPRGYGSFGIPCALRQTEINGCHDFSFNASELLSNDRYHYGGNSFNIDASVTEMGTGVQVNGSASGPSVSYEALKMEFLDDSNGYFKPGMPVFGRVKVSKLDGAPAVNEPVKITASDYKSGVYMDKLFTTNEMGEADYSLCRGFWDNTTSISLSAEAVNFKEDEQVPHNRRLYTPRAHGSFRQWFSPSLSYIQIPARRDTIKCGTTLQLNVPFTHTGLKPYVRFHYQVMSRGRIVQAGTQDAITIPDPLSFLDIGANNCLEVKERPTPAPQPTIPPKVVPDESEGNSSEVAPPIDWVKEEGPEEPPMVEEPLFRAEQASELGNSAAQMEPPMEPPRETLAERLPAEPDAEPVQIQPISEVIGPEDVRRKRSIMPPYETGKEEEIVRSEQISNQVSSVLISINVTSEMSPSFSILLYYIRDDGETVADSMEFKVEPCFENQVKMEFSDKKVMPGTETKIKLEASAGSVCGVGVVDKSVNILGGDHQITPAQVFEKLAQYSLSTRGASRYSYFRSDSSYCKDRMSHLGEEDEMDEMQYPLQISYVHRSYSSSYVDAIEAFKQMGMLVLTNLDVETRPCSWSHAIYYAVPMEREGGGVSVVPLAASADKVRTNFPETWLWELMSVGESGKLDYPVMVPDTITQWVGNSLCINDKAGFGLSPVTSITTFQPFFLAFNLPYNAVRGERLPITVTVYNYLDKCLHMELKVDGMKGFKVHGPHANRAPFCLCGGMSKTRKFYITAQDIGKLPIFARALIVPGVCGNSAQMDTQYINLSDSVERKVLVKAEGVTQRYSHSLYICPKDGETYVKEFSLPLPSDIVKDSARGDVTVIGDIMGPALTNLDNLVRMPTGCGEQNMVGFTPNIYVLKYLTATGRLTELIEDKAKNFMEIGYQRELKYRHHDGSFSAFGPKGEKPGSTWLTAFVVKSFAQAKPYIFIDDKDLQVSIDYLKSMQNPEEGPLSGCFFERGSVFSSYMQGGLGKNASEAALSAYVLAALLEAGLSKQDPVIVNGMQCVNRHVQPNMDVYTFTQIAYVNSLYDPVGPTTTSIMEMLDNKATVDGALKYWKRAGNLPKPVNTWYYHAAPSAEVEMTSYALLAILAFHKDNAVAHAQSTVYWLSQQRNAFGGYASTQDTVLGLNALSEFAAKTFSDAPTNLNLMLNTKDMQADFHISDDNSLILQQKSFVAKQNTMMQVSANGTGCALVQANVRYNKMPNHMGIDDPKFNLRVDPRTYQHDRNRCNKRTIYVTFGQKNVDQFSTGMTMLTVRMVTGWSVIPESLRALKSMYPMLGIEREEVDEEEGVINFYLDQLDLRTRRLALDVEQDKDLRVSSPKPAEVQIYQYYEKDVTVIKSYALKTTCGTKEEIPYDAPATVDGVILQRRINLNQALPSRGGQDRSSGRNEPGPRVEQGPSTPQTPSGPNCPICDLQKAPKNYREIVCNSTAVYKAHAGRNRKYSLKIKANLRPRKKQRDLKWFANIRMAEGCKCSVLDPPQKTVIIVTQKENLNMKDKVLTVDSRTYVFNLRRDRRLEKEARKAQRRCRIN
ncbi:alpha-2-macroglobulin-like protein 1 isoform X2 [Babylonia areolata]|uniref:alpha-2-macroglobulin-like protein 1 isoform X2 n=1 Tax=Babylonia areolata TaxID=304850 RepID=UPI003FD28AC9